MHSHYPWLLVTAVVPNDGGMSEAVTSHEIGDNGGRNGSVLL